jgi:hypothetical protein
MEEKKRVSLSEVRVGIFVIVAVVVLGFAIFRIGSTVGLFQETFHARTYLNNVSGLKAGDLVLLGGVEIGNVTNVHISEPERMPETDTNTRALVRIADWEAQETILGTDLVNIHERIDELRSSYESVALEQGSTSEAARALRVQLDDLDALRNETMRDLDRVREDLQRARDDLQNIVVRMEIQTEYRGWIRKAKASK